MNNETTANDAQAEHPHVDEVSQMSRTDVMETDTAVDADGRTYRVEWNDWAMEPALMPQMTVAERKGREGCMEPCEGCGNIIGPSATILNDNRGDEVQHYHIGCYPGD